MNLGPWAKALVGAAAAGVAPYSAALLPASQGGARVTAGEWLLVAVAVLGASILVWRSDNVRWFKYAKATAAALVVFLGALSVPFLADQTVSVDTILQALLKTALAFGLVSQVPNAAVTEWHDKIGGDGDDEPELDDPEHDDARVWSDADGDGHDDSTGQWMPKAGQVYPEGTSRVDDATGARLYLPPSRVLGYLSVRPA